VFGVSNRNTTEVVALRHSRTEALLPETQGARELKCHDPIETTIGKGGEAASLIKLVLIRWYWRGYSIRVKGQLRKAQGKKKKVV